MRKIPGGNHLTTVQGDWRDHQLRFSSRLPSRRRDYGNHNLSDFDVGFTKFIRIAKGRGWWRWSSKDKEIETPDQWNPHWIQSIVSEGTKWFEGKFSRAMKRSNIFYHTNMRNGVWTCRSNTRRGVDHINDEDGDSSEDFSEKMTVAPAPRNR